MAKSLATVGWQQAVIVLSSTVVGVVVILLLYWAQTVLIPVALAVYLTFLLAPLVNNLHQRHLGRLPSVILVVLLASLILGGTVWLISSEVSNLAGELPKYTQNIKEKIRSLRQVGQGGTAERLEQMMHDLAGEWKTAPPGPERAADRTAGPSDLVSHKPSAVTIEAESPAWLARVPAVLSSLLELLGGLALALVLVVFMLLKRERLRDRLIRLVGHGRLTVTTKAMEDAGRRISRFLLMQFVVNAGFGIVLSLGLYLLQMPHALLWGFFATLLRYVPYLGSGITALLLLTLSLAIFPGWLQAVLLLGLIVVLELITANVVEPKLFGHSIGVSEVALLVSAAFWAFLWGPVGLILSSPLTVCLVVLGKYVPQLEFLDVLLGDEPALDPDITFYQRLLARDQDEAAQQVLAQAKSPQAKEVYDCVLVPALNYVKRDRERDDVTEGDERFILQAMQEIVEDLGERQVAPFNEHTVAQPLEKVRILGCPAGGSPDALALEMLRQLLDPDRWEIEILSLDLLSAEMITKAAEKKPGIICIGALPPGGLARARYLCKRLRAHLPKTRILVGRWGLKDNIGQDEEQLREAGADQVSTTLLKIQTHLNAWLPALASDETKTAAGGKNGAVRMAAVGPS